MNRSAVQVTLDKILGDQEVHTLLMESHQGQIMESDSVEAKLEVETKRERKQQKREQEKIKIEESQKKELEKIKAKEKRWKLLHPFVKFFKWIFSPNTYINLVQRYEELLFVIFINSLTLFTLLSIIYIYIIVIGSKGNDDIGVLYFKIAGSSIVAVICLVAQNYLPSGKNKNEGE